MRNGIRIVAGMIFGSCLLVGLISCYTETPTKLTGELGARPVAATSAEERSELDRMAREDLARMAATYRWRVRMPAALPAGYGYLRVNWFPDNPEQGCSVFIDGPDPAMGNRAIHIIEQPLTPELATNPRNPLIAFRSVVRPVELANGTWQEMQQDHQPWQGSWILMSQLNGLQIQVEGLAPKSVLEQIAGSL